MANTVLDSSFRISSQQNVFFLSLLEQNQKLTEIEAFLFLILISKKETDFKCKNPGILIQSETIIVSYEILAKKWRWSKSKVYRFLQRLSEENLVFISKFQKQSKIKVLENEKEIQNIELTDVNESFYLKNSINGESKKCSDNDKITPTRAEQSQDTLTNDSEIENLLLQNELFDNDELNYTKKEQSYEAKCFKKDTKPRTTLDKTVFETINHIMNQEFSYTGKIANDTVPVPILSFFKKFIYNYINNNTIITTISMGEIFKIFSSFKKIILKIFIYLKNKHNYYDNQSLAIATKYFTYRCGTNWINRQGCPIINLFEDLDNWVSHEFIIKKGENNGKSRRSSGTNRQKAPSNWRSAKQKADFIAKYEKLEKSRAEH